jgi:pyruvate kinase
MARTRIVATLGPATASEDMIRALLDAGVDVFRLNFSHGTQEEHGQRIAAIRRVTGSQPVAIVQDLSGPKLRLDRPVRGQPGDVVPLRLPASVRPGDPVLLADGLMQLEVVDAGHARVVVGGDIPAGKGVNLPSSRLDVPALTDKDRTDLRFGVARGVDFVALSFVRRAADLDEVRASGLPVIAKFEKAEAVENLEEIVRAADAVMVARGDLGVEIPIERVPVVQKELIAAANREASPSSPRRRCCARWCRACCRRAPRRPRGECRLDGTDAVMLSEETAIGSYPVEAVRVMAASSPRPSGQLPARAGTRRGEVAAMIADAACGWPRASAPGRSSSRRARASPRARWRATARACPSSRSRPTRPSAAASRWCGASRRSRPHGSPTSPRSPASATPCVPRGSLRRAPRSSSPPAGRSATRARRTSCT